MSKIVYKIVTKDLKSYIASFCDKIEYKDWIIQYKLDDFVLPPRNTKIFAFEDYSFAENYLNIDLTIRHDLVIYKALTTRVEPCPNRSSVYYSLMKRFWEDTQSCSVENPPGFVWCDDLKLIEEVI